MRTLVVILALGAAWLVSAWSLMLMVGIAHLDWWSVVPVMSYETAMTITGVSVATVVLGQLIKAIVEVAS